MPTRTFLPLGMSLGLLLTACAGVDTPAPQYSRNDDPDSLRLQHMRLRTTGGYPLWLEVKVPRHHRVTQLAGSGGREAAVTFVFTTTISARPRLEDCDEASLESAERRVTLEEVRYARTAMQLEAVATTALHRRYRERGIVEDIYASLPVRRLQELSSGSALSGNLCDLGLRFENWQLEEIRKLLRDAQRERRSASSRASTMLSSMEQ